MDAERKKELKEQFKEIKTVSGIFQIRNTINQKIFVASTPNLKTMTGKRLELGHGSFRNEVLQKEWNEYGEEAFVFEVLEELKEKEGGYYNKNDDLKRMKDKWLEKLQPYGNKGYN
ncbi:MAG: GIY-YIG nuclease family protein [Clostridia bacterium]